MVKLGLGPIKEKSVIMRSLRSIQSVELEISHNYHYNEIMTSIGFIPLIRIKYEDEILNPLNKLKRSTKYGIINSKS
jgi:hypothetical protein